jgi:putative membrane protein
MMYWDGWDGIGAFGWFGMLLMMVFWFGLIALLIWGVAGLLSRSQQTSGPAPTSEDRALGLLRERFARGEITEQEYTDAKLTLDATTR